MKILMLFLTFHLLAQSSVFARETRTLNFYLVRKSSLTPSRIKSFHLIDQKIIFPEEIKSLYFNRKTPNLRYLDRIELKSGEVISVLSILEVEIKRVGGETGGGG